jgi:hypothetical protein
MILKERIDKEIGLKVQPVHRITHARHKEDPETNTKQFPSKYSARRNKIQPSIPLSIYLRDQFRERGDHPRARVEIGQRR